MGLLAWLRACVMPVYHGTGLCHVQMSGFVRYFQLHVTRCGACIPPVVVCGVGSSVTPQSVCSPVVLVHLYYLIWEGSKQARISGKLDIHPHLVQSSLATFLEFCPNAGKEVLYSDPETRRRNNTR